MGSHVCYSSIGGDEVMLHDFIKTENLVAIGLVVALIISLFTGPYELSMSIASGLIGYIGRGEIKKLSGDGK